jgi:hypothetical protein
MKVVEKILNKASGLDSPPVEELRRLQKRFLQQPLKRIFFIDRECYIIYSGSEWDDLNPFARIGSSSFIDESLDLGISYILISDFFTGNISIESYLFNLRSQEYELLKGLVPDALYREIYQDRNSYVGNGEPVNNLFNYLGFTKKSFLAPEKDERNLRNRTINFVTKKKYQRGPDRKDKVIASFFDNHDIKIFFREISSKDSSAISKEQIIFDLYPSLEKDLNHSAEISFFQNQIKSLSLHNRKTGWIDDEGQLLFHDASHFMIINPSKPNCLLKALKWKLYPNGLEGIYIDKKNEKTHDPLLVTFLQNLYKLYSIKSVKLISDSEEIFQFEKLYQHLMHNVRSFENLNFEFSSRFQANCHAPEKQIVFSRGGNIKDIEIRLDSNFGNLKSKIAVLPALPKRFQKQSSRQAFIIREDFPDKFYNPYTFFLPKNYRYELRNITTAQDLNDLLAEFNDYKNSLMIEPNDQDFYNDFFAELADLVKKLMESSYHLFDPRLKPISPHKKLFKGRNKEHTPWFRLFQFNRYYIQWQLSGKRGILRNYGFLKKLNQEGNFHFGFLIQFQDSQALMLYLPELNPLAFLSGMENPLKWEGQNIDSDRSFAALKERILAQDIGYFEGIFDSQVKNCPLTDNMVQQWKGFYRNWISYYVRQYREIFMERARLRELINLLKEISISELGKIIKEKDSREKGNVFDEFEKKLRVTSFSTFKSTISSISQKVKTAPIFFQKSKYTKVTVAGFFSLAILAILFKFFFNINNFSSKDEPENNHQVTSKVQVNKENGIELEKDGKILQKSRQIKKISLIRKTAYIKDNVLEQNPLVKMIVKITENLEQNDFLWINRELLYAGKMRVELGKNFPTDNDIFLYLNKFAILNGYSPVKFKKDLYDNFSGFKNPNWIYPGNHLKKPNGKLWIVKKGESFWSISRTELKKNLRQMLFYTYLTDMIIVEIAKKIDLPVDVFALDDLGKGQSSILAKIAAKRNKSENKLLIELREKIQDKNLQSALIGEMYQKGYLGKDKNPTSGHLIENLLQYCEEFTKNARNFAALSEHREIIRKREEAIKFLQSIFQLK